jgi:hypothetical protein
MKSFGLLGNVWQNAPRLRFAKNVQKDLWTEWSTGLCRSVNRVNDQERIPASTQFSICIHLYLKNNF